MFRRFVTPTGTLRIPENPFIAMLVTDCCFI